MGRLRYITLLLAVCSALLLASCDRSGDKPEEPSTPQTIIVYMAGTDLGWAFAGNIQDIENALLKGIQKQSRVVVVWQNGRATQAEAMELIYKEGIIERKTINTYDLPQAMDSATLGGIFRDVMRFAPAASYGLIMGAHSWAWVPIDNYDEIKYNGMTKAEMLKRPRIEIPRHMLTRFIGDPSKPQNRFDITTLAEAIDSTGEQFEYILFDACFMANVEAAYELRNCTKYIIGSACEIMGSGFPYLQTMPYLLQDGGRSYDLKRAAETYHTHYKNTLGYSGTISLIACSQLDALAEAMKRVNKSMNKEYQLSEIQTYEGGTNHIFFDLGDYIDKACSDSGAVTAFRTQLAKTVPAKFTLDTFWTTYVNPDYYPITSYSGLSTSAPSVLCRDAYIKSAWYQATH